MVASRRHSHQWAYNRDADSRRRHRLPSHHFRLIDRAGAPSGYRVARTYPSACGSLVSPWFHTAFREPLRTLACSMQALRTGVLAQGSLQSIRGGTRASTGRGWYQRYKRMGPDAFRKARAPAPFDWDAPAPEGEEAEESERRRPRRRAFFDMAVDGVPAGRVEFELASDLLPVTSENFLRLCEGVPVAKSSPSPSPSPPPLKQQQGGGGGEELAEEEEGEEEGEGEAGEEVLGYEGSVVRCCSCRGRWYYCCSCCVRCAGSAVNSFPAAGDAVHIVNRQLVDDGRTTLNKGVVTVFLCRLCSSQPLHQTSKPKSACLNASQSSLESSTPAATTAVLLL